MAIHAAGGGCDPSEHVHEEAHGESGTGASACAKGHGEIDTARICGPRADDRAEHDERERDEAKHGSHAARRDLRPPDAKRSEEHQRHEPPNQHLRRFYDRRRRRARLSAEGLAMIERSHNKARPTLVRASDLRPADTASKPAEARTADGRFAAGNRAAASARFTHAIRKSLGDKAAQGEALVVARDARRLFGHVLASLPSDAPPVRALLAVYSRHQALHAYYTLKAEAAGLDTEQGLALLAVADRQSQRAERVLVTVHDLARIHAAKAQPIDAHGALVAALEVPKGGAA